MKLFMARLVCNLIGCNFQEWKFDEPCARCSRRLTDLEMWGL